MTIWIFLFGLLLAGGLFFILADLLRLPTLATQKAMLSAGRQAKVKTRSAEALMLGWALKLSRIVRMDEYKRNRMANTLNAAGMGMTPEVFTAYALVRSGLVMLGVIPGLYVLPLLAPVLLFLSVMVYFKEIRAADEKLKGKRGEIEQELSRFVATITQELKANREWGQMGNNYLKSLFAVGFQGFLMMVCIAIYAVLLKALYIWVKQLFKGCFCFALKEVGPM